MITKTALRQIENLTHAYRIVETLVLRTKLADVFTIEVGETLLGYESSAFGGKVTLQSNPPRHIGFCEAASPEEVVQAAEALIASASLQKANSASVPKPHMNLAASRINA